MGIDIYLRWRGMTKKQKEKQYNGFDPYMGHTGYLREAYHGAPYPSKILVREAFESKAGKAKIPASLMRERLSHVTEPARDVGLNAAALEAVMSKIQELADNNELKQVGIIKVDTENFSVDSRDNAAMTVEEAVLERCRVIYPDLPPEKVQKLLQSYRDFVDLAEKMEKKKGAPCTVYASY